MKCDNCKEDKCTWTELKRIERIDSTQNCGKIFHPHKPWALMLCNDCELKRRTKWYHGGGSL